MARKIPKKILGIALKLSEGKDVSKVDSIAGIVEKQTGIILLDLRRRDEKNMTILKFAGRVEHILVALMKISHAAFNSIDFSGYDANGNAVGVISSIVFIPVRGLRLTECREIARQFSQQFYEEFQQPVFYFGRAFSKRVQEVSVLMHQHSASEIKQSILSGKLHPDVGDALYHREWGLTLMGIRKFIVTFVLMLDSGDLEVAQRIADILGKNGAVKLDEQGNPIADKAGNPVREPGLFPLVDTMAMASDNEKLTRIICNLHDYKNPTITKLYQVAKKVAAEYVVEVLGSQIIGYLPQDVLFAGMNNLPKSKKFVDDDFQIRLKALEKYLVLNKYGEFNAHWQIIDFRFL